MKKRTMITVLLISLLAVMFFSCSETITGNDDSGPNKYTALFEKLQEALDQILEDNSQCGKGVTAAVVMPNGETWTGATGISGDDNSEMKPDMLLDIADVRNLYTAALILKFNEEGLLSLSDSISKWLPEYPNIDHSITIRQLLEHTTGLFNYWQHASYPFNAWPLVNFNKVWTPEEVLTTLIDAPYFSPGDDWSRSSTNYLILTMIIDAIVDSGRVEAFHDRFFDPLGLSNTFISYFETIPGERIAHPWYDNVDVSGYPRTAIATLHHQSMYVTAEDYAKWIFGLFEGGILSQASLDEMTSFKYTDEGGIKHGMDISQRFLYGVEFWERGGWEFGYETSVLYSPEHKFSIAVMHNHHGSTTSTSIPPLVKTILDGIY